MYVWPTIDLADLGRQVVDERALLGDDLVQRADVLHRSISSTVFRPSPPIADRPRQDNRSSSRIPARGSEGTLERPFEQGRTPYDRDRGGQHPEHAQAQSPPRAAGLDEVNRQAQRTKSDDRGPDGGGVPGAVELVRRPPRQVSPQDPPRHDDAQRHLRRHEDDVCQGARSIAAASGADQLTASGSP